MITERGVSHVASGSKKEMMFERMREKKKEVKVVRKIVFIITLAVVLIGLIGGFFTYNYIVKGLKPLDPDSEKVINIEVPIGSGLDGISKQLENEGVIKDARLFKYYAKFNNESQFQAGTYDLTQAMTFDELIQSLKSGKVYREPVFTMTIPEGLTIAEIADVVEKRTKIPADTFIDYVNDGQTIERLMAKFSRIVTEEVLSEDIKFPLEGYLFPATYPFYEEEPTLDEIVDVMVQATATNLTPYLDKLEEDGHSVHWLLTFSSMLEREATAQSDRATIASVFYNRLEVDMPLQTDPTVLYAHGQHKSKTLLSDLEIDDPYNTYKYKGMPPGPIANSGMTSIEAVLDPEVGTGYLFFLADQDGVNHFSKDYDEHLRKKAEYID